jgi:hypothetical protein
MKNVVYLFAIIFLLSCASDPYPIEGLESLKAKPLYFALVTNQSPRIYHDSVYPLSFSDVTIFKRFDGGKVRASNTEYKLDTTQLDFGGRLYNTAVNTDFKAGESITFEKEEVKGSCIMPESADFDVSIESIEEIPAEREYAITVLVKLKNHAVLQNVSMDAAIYFDDKYITIFNPQYNLKFVRGVSWTDFNQIYPIKELPTDSFKVRVGVSSVKTGRQKIIIPPGQDLKGRIRMEYRMYNVDDNIMNYIEFEDKNATGVENPLAIYADSYKNLINAFGFMGCYSTSKKEAKY